jgi:hypothetical protein
MMNAQNLREPTSDNRTGRDVRVDQVGFVAELVKHHADHRKSEVKCSMLEKGLDRVAGDFFAGHLVTSSSAEIDVAKFFKLFEQEKLSKKDLLACISVSRASASKALGQDAIARLLVEKPPVHQLRVERVKGVEVSLVDAVKHLAVA